ncbi:MAG: hypothetical protein VX939_10420 [Pseudomonadota bacterium]|nr:hypothetical protein [Pseudomonadota bacterium]
MRLNLALALLPTFLLASCGGGGDAIDTARDIPNRFGNTVNALDDFSESSTGDSSNARGLEANQVRVTMEVPVYLAPGGEATRRNLRIVVPDRVAVYRTNHTLQPLGDVAYQTETGEDGHVVLTFDNGVPIGPDVVVEASYRGVAMKALAADADQDVKVNPFSHYLVEASLGRYTASEFQTVMNCVNDAGGGLCLNKYVWSTLSDQVHDFEIDIPDNANISQALGILGDRADFARYVDNMADYALLGQTETDSIRASSADYNSVFMALELGQTRREASISGAGQWGVRTAQEEQLTESGSAYLYPALTLTSFEAFNINVTSLATDIPYDRSTLIHDDQNRFFLRDSWALNTHASAPGAATLTPPQQDGEPATDARLLAGRSLYQSITDRQSATINGWTRNPYYFDAWTSPAPGPNTSPDRVLGGYFSAGKAIGLEAIGEQLKRGDTLETYNLSVLELHLQRQTGFEVDPVANQTYNLVYLAGQFANGSAPTFRLGDGTWDFGAANGQVVEGLTDINEFTLSRDNTGGLNSVVNKSPVWSIGNRQSRLSNGDVHMGRLNLFENSQGSNPDFGQPDLGLGAASPAGDLLAFNLIDSPLGNGLVIAAAPPTAAAPSEGDYRLQGVLIGFTATDNRLYHLDNATLTLSGGGSATVDGQLIQVTQRFAEREVSQPGAGSLQTAFTYQTPGNGRFDFVSGDELTFNGFFAGDGDQIFLKVTDTTGPEQRAGLFIATRVPEAAP